MQRQHVDTDLHIQQSFVDMLRVVFDSECDEELRVGDDVVYECSFVITIGVSDGISKHITVVESIGVSDTSSSTAVGVTLGITVVSGDIDSDIATVIVSDSTTFGISVVSTVCGQYNVRSVGGDRGE